MRELYYHICLNMPGETERFPESSDSGTDPGTGESKSAGTKTAGENTEKLLLSGLQMPVYCWR